MKRKEIRIDKEACIGCGACANTCHQGVIEMIDGKAVATKKSFCDGLERCLPVCPTNAITFEEVEIHNDELAEEEGPTCPGKMVKTIAGNTGSVNSEPLIGGCPGSNSKLINTGEEKRAAENPNDFSNANQPMQQQKSMLQQWPVQIKLVPIKAPYFKDANLLIAADCSAFAYGNFHQDFMRNHVTLIGCPKLDEGDYTEKLTEIIKNNDIKSVKAVRMEVPCCGGIENAAKNAIQKSGKFIPWQVVTLSLDGKILD